MLQKEYAIALTGKFPALVSTILFVNSVYIRTVSGLKHFNYHIMRSLYVTIKI